MNALHAFLWVHGWIGSNNHCIYDFIDNFLISAHIRLFISLSSIVPTFFILLSSCSKYTLFFIFFYVLLFICFVNLYTLCCLQLLGAQPSLFLFSTVNSLNCRFFFIRINFIVDHHGGIIFVILIGFSRRLELNLQLRLNPIQPEGNFAPP